MSTKTNAQKIKAYFETNPTAHVPAASVAKALKMGATSCADALGKMAVAGELHREKKQSGDSTKEVWIYSLPALETLALPRTAKAFKPLTTKQAYRRPAGAIETAPSVIGGPEKVHASAQAVALLPQPEVGKNTGSLESGVSDKSLTEAQAGESTPAAAEPAAGDAEMMTTMAMIISDSWQERAEKAEGVAGALVGVLTAIHVAIGDQEAKIDLQELPGHIAGLLAAYDARAVDLIDSSNAAATRADDLEAQALTLEQYQKILAEHHIESPAELRYVLDSNKIRISELEEATAISATLEAKSPEAYAVVAPKKPIQRFTARKNADQAAARAARMVGKAEIYGMYRIAQASRGAVVIQEG